MDVRVMMWHTEKIHMDEGILAKATLTRRASQREVRNKKQ